MIAKIKEIEKAEDIRKKCLEIVYPGQKNYSALCAGNIEKKCIGMRKRQKKN